MAITAALLTRVSELRTAYMAIILGNTGNPDDTLIEWGQFTRMGRLETYLENRLERN